MFKRIAVLALCSMVAVGSVGAASVDVNAATYPYIYSWDSGSYVEDVQKMLIQRGYHVGDIDGINGPNTTAAIIQFQKDNNLSPDGIVGPLTWAALKNVSVEEESSAQPQLAYGDTGTYVAKLQRMLNERGFKCGEADGIFGKNTLNAVVAFQQSKGLLADGIVGRMTWTELNDAEIADSDQNETQCEYIKISKGDTLTAIAKKYGVTVDEICRVNGITNPNLIYIDQTIAIPSKETGKDNTEIESSDISKPEDSSENTEDSKPEVEESKPEESVTDKEESIPEESKPNEESSKPSDDSQPTVEDSKPEGEGSKPSEESKPSDEESNPDSEESKPNEEEKEPEEESKPENDDITAYYLSDADIQDITSTLISYGQNMCGLTYFSSYEGSLDENTWDAPAFITFDELKEGAGFCKSDLIAFAKLDLDNIREEWNADLANGFERDVYGFAIEVRTPGNTSFPDQNAYEVYIIWMLGGVSQ